MRAERERRPFDNNERGTSHFPDFPLLIVHSCEAIYCAASVTARPVASRSMALRNGPLRYASSSGVGDSFVRVIVPPMVLGDRLPPAVRGPPSRNRGRSHHPPDSVGLRTMSLAASPLRDQQTEQRDGSKAGQQYPDLDDRHISHSRSHCASDLNTTGKLPDVRPSAAVVAKLPLRVRHRAKLDFCALGHIRNHEETVR